MYRCFHCGDLHFSADQARVCAECGDEWIPDAIAELKRQAIRGPLPWALKMAYRTGLRWTDSERRLWKHLRRRLPSGVLRTQWWLDHSDYRVDFLVSPIDLVVEVDGSSHQQRQGADRLRSLDMRAKGYTVARVTADLVMEAADSIAARVAFRAVVNAEGISEVTEQLAEEAVV